jgi:hypothetical protein
MTEKAVNYDLTTRLAVANAGLVAHGACGITPNAWKRFKRALMRAPANYVSVQGSGLRTGVVQTVAAVQVHLALIAIAEPWLSGHMRDIQLL